MSVAMGLKCKENEREALLSLKHGFVISNARLSSWGSGENQRDCCEWEGIVCSNTTGHVVQLDLHPNLDTDYPLQGIISPSLAELRHLNHLDLSGNSFYVHIPKFIGSLTNLKYLNLSDSFDYGTGTVPNELWNLSRLQYLDLSWNNLVGDFPSQLTNLTHLKHLDLGQNRFTGKIPHHLANLSHLQYLSIGTNLAKSNLEWLPSLSSSLTTLALHGVNLSSVYNWFQLVTNLPHLRHLELVNCSLPDIDPLSISNMNISASLTHIDLSRNNRFTSSIFAWLLNYNSSLQTLRLEGNKISEIPVSLWDICSLRELELYSNKLSGQLYLFLPTYPHCAQQSLEILDLSDNQITGTMPDLSQLSSLQQLWIGSNKMNGTLSKSIGKLPKLEVLYVGNNYLQGLVTEAHFSGLPKLRRLSLSLNHALVLNFSDDWVPPFQLVSIDLSSCKVGPKFPRWLLTQKNYSILLMSSAGISDTVPCWFWKLPPTLTLLDLSNNQIRGKIPNYSVKFNSPPFTISLSSNFLIGPIPSFFSQAQLLFLSYNNFTNSSSFLCSDKAKDLSFLDLSNNQLTYLPDCWMNLKSLIFLNLSNNHLYGHIPTTVGSLVNLQVLHLQNNKLTGEVPASLNHCKELRTFDVSHNKLSGPIPSWIGYKLDKLKILILRSNQFNGTLPRSLCFLSHVQILDLSVNNITGSIPRCVKNLNAMSDPIHQSETITVTYDLSVGGRSSGIYFFFKWRDSAWVIWKGKESRYESTLRLLRSIDLSSNNLVGEIPSELMDLVGLVSLNLSENKLSGKIPSNIGQLKSLDSLDLSRNSLFGRIPSGLSEIDRLGVLDLSYNNLSGRIPVGTQLQSFNATSFSGNPELCGAPLPKNCPGEEKRDHQNHESNTDDDQLVDRGFYVSFAIGFFVGFVDICFSLIFIRSWRYHCFKFFNLFTNGCMC